MFILLYLNMCRDDHNNHRAIHCLKGASCCATVERIIFVRFFFCVGFIFAATLKLILPRIILQYKFYKTPKHENKVSLLIFLAVIKKTAMLY